MRKLIAWVFMYSLDGLLADEGTEYWQFCFGLPVDPADLKQKLGVYQGAYAHIMGRAAYEGMAGALPTADHPFSGIMNAARKVVFSRWLMRLDLIDEFRVALHPYVAGEGTRLFDDVPGSYGWPGLEHRVQQRDRRAALPPAPLERRPTCRSMRRQHAAEAGAVAEPVASRHRTWPYDRLVEELLDKPTIAEVAGKSGASHQVEVAEFWDSGRPGDLRVMVAVDDGGFSAFRPLTVGFIVRPDGTFVDR